MEEKQPTKEIMLPPNKRVVVTEDRVLFYERDEDKS